MKHSARQANHLAREMTFRTRSSAVSFAEFVPVQPSHASVLRGIGQHSVSRKSSRARYALTPFASFDVPKGNSYLQVTAATALRTFLTGRAVRTIAYYYSELRDIACLRWLLTFDNFEDKVAKGIFDDEKGLFLNKMLHAEPYYGTYVVGHPRGNFKREYKFKIDPMNIASRVLAARSQLAEEWTRDLRCIALENKEIIRMGMERMVSNDERHLNSLRGRVFDYDNVESDQTPLRFKNYGKLKLLVTQQAIARYELFLRDTSNHDYLFFRTYVQSSLPLKDDEAFILGLMNSPPVFRVNPMHEIVPSRLAQGVMDMRAAVADECIAVMKAVPDEHAHWSRQRLEASMSMNATLGEDFPTSPS